MRVKLNDLNCINQNILKNTRHYELSGFPLQNLAFQGGDVVVAKTSIVEKT